MNTTPQNKTVLISGASISGPTLAYWLNRYGFQVTVVEKAPELRKGGNSVDLRGPTLEIASMMGVLDIARAYSVITEKVTFVDETGDLVGSVVTDDISGGDYSTDVEIPRGDLVRALVEAAGDGVEWIFGDSVVAIDDRADGAQVTFASGGTRTFDIVVGTDGVRSRTRRLGIDASDQAVQYLGYCFALFSIPNYLGLKHENLSWNIPGKMAVFLPTEDDEVVHGMLMFSVPTPPPEIYGDPELARALVAKNFEGYGWEIPRMLESLRTSDDFYFDSANFVAASTWSKGRVVVAGDAGYGPSLFTGQGSGLAIIGAYILAGELARNESHAEAFAEYERLFRPYVTDIQKIVPGMIFNLAPRTEDDLNARNAGIQHPESTEEGPEPDLPEITLPDYSDLVVEHSRS